MAESLQELPGCGVVASKDGVGGFDAFGNPFREIFLDRLQRIFPIQRNGPPKRLGVFLLQRDLDEVFLALGQIDILKADVVEFLGPRAAIEQDGDQESLSRHYGSAYRAVRLQPPSRNPASWVDSECPASGQCFRLGRAQAPTQEDLQQHAHVHLGAVGERPP